MRSRSLYILTTIFLVLSLLSCDKDSGLYTTSDYKLTSADPILNDSSDYIIVLGDIQTYTCSSFNMPYFKQTIEWIYSQKLYGKKIGAILQVGDISDTNSFFEWDNFHNTVVGLSTEVPIFAVTGNHDYTWHDGLILNRNETKFNSYIDFPLTLSQIVTTFEKDKLDNAIYENVIGNERLDIIALEFGPRKEVLEWANEYVKNNPERRFVLLTHEFLTAKGQRVSKSSYAEVQFRNTTWSSPEMVWNSLVKDNDNIVCVLCGHNGFTRQLLSKNNFGREVPQILFNIQYQPHGGDGFIEIWEIPQNGDIINAFIYNTITKSLYNGENSSFSFPYKY